MRLAVPEIIYSVAWVALDRIELAPDTPTRERLTIANLFLVIWGWIQSYSPPIALDPPAQATNWVLTADHSCLRCGAIATGPFAGTRRFVSGSCSHEWVSKEDRRRMWERPPTD